MAGAPCPITLHISRSRPRAFTLAYAAQPHRPLPLIGGMTSWIGPIIGAVFLGTVQQVATVTISVGAPPAESSACCSSPSSHRATTAYRSGCS